MVSIRIRSSEHGIYIYIYAHTYSTDLFILGIRVPHVFRRVPGSWWCSDGSSKRYLL